MNLQNLEINFMKTLKKYLGNNNIDRLKSNHRSILLNVLLKKTDNFTMKVSSTKKIDDSIGKNSLTQCEHTN